MEKLANRLAESAARSAGLDEERKKVVAYGLGALIQMLSLMVASLIFGFLFHCLVESMTIFLAVGIFKSSAGGAHARTTTSCTFISLVSIFLMSLIARYVVPVVPAYWPVYLAFTILAFCCRVRRRVPPRAGRERQQAHRAPGEDPAAAQAELRSRSAFSSRISAALIQYGMCPRCINVGDQPHPGGLVAELHADPGGEQVSILLGFFGFGRMN